MKTAEAELQSEAARLAKAQAILGHRFRDERLLLQALTHRSLLNEKPSALGHNEVLELLGDAVLSLCTVEQLVRGSPDADEGELTERRAAHVSEDALARKADEAGLVALLRTGRSIATQVPPSARADIVEAVLGAVYLDAGLEAARAVYARVLGAPPTHTTVAGQNAKRVLQERLQALVGAAPTYDVTRGDGPQHAPTYHAVARHEAHVLGAGTGANKRAATEAAAADALATLEPDDAALAARLGRP